MSDKNTGKPKVLILESQDHVRKYVEKILTLAGWETFGIKTPTRIPQILKKDISHPFALFICNYEQSREQDHRFLRNVKNISPVTQRLVLVPEAHTHILTQVVNKIGIRACISIPCKPKVLVQQVRSSLRYFNKISKRMRMQRIIAHQNQQLYQVAKKMREKEAALKGLVNERKFEKQILKRVDEQGQCTLEERLICHNISRDPENLSREHCALENEIFQLFGQAASEMGLEMPAKEDLSSPGEEQMDIAFLETTKKILQTVLGSVPDLHKTDQKEDDPVIGPEDMEEDAEPSALDPFFLVRISRDRLMAFVEKSDESAAMEEKVSLNEFLDFLRIRGISYGIVDDKIIESWLENAQPHDPLQVAQGAPPFTGQDGKVIYHFENMSVSAGTIQEDGSIDFKERVNIPHVSEGDLLAEKVPAVEGSCGTTVGGSSIPVPDPIDPPFGIQSNAYFSEDELSIFSSIDGQPHVDTLGAISVNPEMVINGDVGYESGNIHFDGNVVVKGSIREGFSVKCVNLMVEGMEGADIVITGDLNVTAGITESKVSAMGHIQAKFVNKSLVSTFGDLTVQKEILDSEIFLGGACNNSTGHIIASKIIARGGLDAGSIGTDSSPACMIGVGKNDLAERTRARIKKQMKKMKTQYQSVERTMEEMAAKDQELYPVIINKTHGQETIMSSIKSAKEKLSMTIASGDMQPIPDLEKEVDQLEKKKESLEKELDQLFSLQDDYLKTIDSLKASCEKLKEKENRLMVRLQEIKQFEKNTPVVPEAVVNKSVTRKTIVRGTSSYLIVDKAESACRIQEVKKKDSQRGETQAFMIIGDLS